MADESRGGGMLQALQGRYHERPQANGGLLMRDLALPDFRDYAIEVSKPA